MKKCNFRFVGMLVTLLAFGIMLAACSNSSASGDSGTGTSGGSGSATSMTGKYISNKVSIEGNSVVFNVELNGNEKNGKLKVTMTTDEGAETADGTYVITDNLTLGDKTFNTKAMTVITSSDDGVVIYDFEATSTGFKGKFLTGVSEEGLEGVDIIFTKK